MLLEIRKIYQKLREIPIKQYDQLTLQITASSLQTATKNYYNNVNCIKDCYKFTKNFSFKIKVTIKVTTN